MKKHIMTLFDAAHLKKTILLFAIAVLFIIISSVVGISDNFPMIAMLLTGLILLFFSVLHPWKEAFNYGILAIVCIGIIGLEVAGISILAKMDKTEFLDKNEGIVWIITGIFCIPGLLVGMIGAIICSVRKK
jgi:hypothetical protein